MWSVIRVPWGEHKEHLAKGWEPFAVVAESQILKATKKKLATVTYIYLKIKS